MWLFGVEMTTSKKLISSWKTNLYIKISTLKKQKLKSKLEEQTPSKIPTNDLAKLAVFVLKNNFFEFNNKIKQ